MAQRSYGLDVKILSPPHIVLAVGLLALHLGALVMLAGAMNRSDGARRPTLEVLVLIVGGNMVVALMTLFMEKTVRPFMHLGSFYLIVGLCVPVVLCGRAGGDPPALGGRARRSVAYSVFLLALLWTFPLVPAQPKLGPVLVPVTNLIPPEFPLLLLPAALALDAWFWRRRARPGIATVAGGALLFTAIFLACQWPFATFLMSTARPQLLLGRALLRLLDAAVHALPPLPVPVRARRADRRLAGGGGRRHGALDRRRSRRWPLAGAPAAMRRATSR